VANCHHYFRRDWIGWEGLLFSSRWLKRSHSSCDTLLLVQIANMPKLHPGEQK